MKRYDGLTGESWSNTYVAKDDAHGYLPMHQFENHQISLKTMAEKPTSTTTWQTPENADSDAQKRRA
jgi:hypothetical protein